MYRSGTGFCKLGFRVRAGEIYDREEEEIDKYSQLGCKAEQAVHLIPFILLACLLVLYIFSYTPVEGSVPGNGSVKEVKPASISMGSKAEVLPTFSVYNHRRLHQVQKQQQKIKKDFPKQQKETSRPVVKGNKYVIRRTRPNKIYLHRKVGIIHNN